MTTTIWDKNELHVWVSIEENGDLEVAGQDLNGWAGDDEYQYWITVKARGHPQGRRRTSGLGRRRRHRASSPERGDADPGRRADVS